jgi:RecA/RadA recombinase
MEDQAALPTLGSTELDYVLRNQASMSRVKTSCTAFDAILKDGVESGRITCISGDRGTGKTTVRPNSFRCCLLTHLDCLTVDCVSRC